MRPDLRLLVAASMVLGLTGCDFWYDKVPSPDDLMKKVPWFDHMIKSPAVHPYETGDVPRTAVPGTVPVTLLSTPEPLRMKAVPPNPWVP